MTPVRARTSRFGLLLAAALAAAPLLPAFVPGRSLFYRDIGQTHFPCRLLGARMLASGGVGLWNPFRGNGQPFLANPNSLLLRPTSLFFLLLPASRAHLALALSAASLLGVAAAGTFLLLRETGHSRRASLLGACAFALSGTVQSLVQVMNHLEGVAWIPITLFLLQRAFVRGWRPWGILAAAGIALIVASGEPIWGAVTLMGALALPAVRSVGARRLARVAVPVVLLAALIAAVQVLPLAELAARGERAEGLPAKDVLRWSLPPRAILQTFVPALWGDPTRAGPASYWGSGLFDTSLPWLLSVHVGAPILILALAGLYGGTGRRNLHLMLIAAAGAILAMGRYVPFAGVLVRTIPGLGGVRYPVKWFVLTSLCLAVLAAGGLDNIVTGRHVLRWKSAGGKITAALAASCLAAGLLAWSGRAGFAVPWVRALLRVPAAIGDGVLAASALPAIGSGLVLGSACALLIVVLSARAPETGVALRLNLIVGGSVAALLAGAWGLNPTAPSDLVFAPPAFLPVLQGAVHGSQRLFTYPRPRGFAFRAPTPEQAGRAGLPLDSLAWGMRWDVRTLRFWTSYPLGVHHAYDQNGGDRLGLLPGARVAADLGEGLPLDQEISLWRAASVGYVLAYEDLQDPRLELVASLPGESNFTTRLYKYDSSLPRAYLVGRAETAADAREAIEAIRTGRVDPAQSVLLTGPGAAAAADGGRDPARGTARILIDEPEKVVVEADSSGPAWLVLTDTYESSWRARVDGEPVPVFRADGMFRAVRTPAGRHRIRFSYLPVSFVAGAALSVIGILVAAILLLTGRRVPPAGAPLASA